MLVKLNNENLTNLENNVGLYKRVHSATSGADGLIVLNNNTADKTIPQNCYPIEAFVIYPTTSAQRRVNINHNPYNGSYYGQCSALPSQEVKYMVIWGKVLSE